MSIVQKINDDLLAARKARETAKATTLSTLLGEVVKIGKDDGNRVTTDAEAVKITTKFIKSITETRDFYALQDNVKALAKKNKLNAELEIVSKYVPQKLSLQEQEEAVKTIISSLTVKPTIGQVIGEMKKQYPDRYDGAVVSALAKQLIG